MVVILCVVFKLKLDGIVIIGIRFVKMSEKKEKSLRGIKTRAGQLLSQYLRAIAEEKTEFIKGEDGEDKMATKAESLARLIWANALGYVEEEVDDSGKITKTLHRPDKSMIHLVFDRIEGKAAMVGETKKSGTVADKVSDQGKKRISQAGNLDANN